MPSTSAVGGRSLAEPTRGSLCGCRRSSPTRCMRSSAVVRARISHCSGLDRTSGLRSSLDEPLAEIAHDARRKVREELRALLRGEPPSEDPADDRRRALVALQAADGEPDTEQRDVRRVVRERWPVVGQRLQALPRHRSGDLSAYRGRPGARRSGRRGGRRRVARPAPTSARDQRRDEERGGGPPRESSAFRVGLHVASALREGLQCTHGPCPGARQVWGEPTSASGASSTGPGSRRSAMRLRAGSSRASTSSARAGPARVACSGSVKPSGDCRREESQPVVPEPGVCASVRLRPNPTNSMRGLDHEASASSSSSSVTSSQPSWLRQSGQVVDRKRVDLVATVRAAIHLTGDDCGSDRSRTRHGQPLSWTLGPCLPGPPPPERRGATRESAARLSPRGRERAPGALPSTRSRGPRRAPRRASAGVRRGRS